MRSTLPSGCVTGLATKPYGFSRRQFLRSSASRLRADALMTPRCAVASVARPNRAAVWGSRGATDGEPLLFRWGVLRGPGFRRLTPCPRRAVAIRQTVYVLFAKCHCWRLSQRPPSGCAEERSEETQPPAVVLHASVCERQRSETLGGAMRVFHAGDRPDRSSGGAVRPCRATGPPMLRPQHRRSAPAASIMQSNRTGRQVKNSYVVGFHDFEPSLARAVQIFANQAASPDRDTAPLVLCCPFAVSYLTCIYLKRSVLGTLCGPVSLTSGDAALPCKRHGG